MAANSMRPILDGLLARLNPALPGSALGEVLNRLLWLTDDNGTDVIAVCREWLDSDDLRKVEAALSIEEGWLFDDPVELSNRLGAVASRWPQVTGRVKQILDAYETQHAR
jgi:hypothetical protein